MAKFENDKYYATDEIKQILINELRFVLYNYPVDEYVEPSAGNGAFIDVLKNHLPSKPCIFMDIEPEHSEIVKQDFLEWNPEFKERAFIGGPPFGCKLYYNFLKQCKNLNAKVIAFISPTSVLGDNYFKENYRQLIEKDLGPTTFLSNKNEKHKVKACLKIWVRDDNFKILKDFYDKKIEEGLRIFNAQINYVHKTNNKCPFIDYKFRYRFSTRKNAGTLITDKDFKEYKKETFIGINVLDEKLEPYLNDEWANNFRNNYIPFIKHYSTTYASLNKPLFIKCVKDTLKKNYKLPESMEAFIIKFKPLIDLGVIRFSTNNYEGSTCEKEIVIIDIFNDNGYMLCEKSESRVAAARQYLKKLGYTLRADVGTYMKSLSCN
jgi:hypothetical protein